MLQEHESGVQRRRGADLVVGVADGAGRGVRLVTFPGRGATACAAAVGAAAVGAVLYGKRVEPWLRAWGATPAEQARRLPIDDLVEPGTIRVTRAITVHAPVDDVWPWLAQIGQDRAGFYSYTWLENLVAAGMHNAAAIHPEWQQREPGDSVWLASRARWHERGRQIAALVEPPHTFVLVSPADWARLQRGDRASGAWGFFLEPSGAYATRFLVRSSGGAVGTHLFDLLHFAMEQKMMRGLRDRAEMATS
jgi:hypothetical protein